jgi:hypothetical protein
MHKYKQKLINETKTKINALQTGFQEPFLSEFSKIAELDNICRDILSNLLELKVFKKAENFINKNNNGEKNDSKRKITRSNTFK